MWIMSKAFWTATTERAVKTAAQSVLTVWGVGDVALNALTLDWPLAGGVALGGAIASLLTSIVSAGVGPSDSPSLVGASGRRGE
ncbi:holin [Pseudonocardia sichuanensis]